MPQGRHAIRTMKETGPKIPVRIAYIGGGSLNWAMGLMADLAHDVRLEAEVRLYDIDEEAARRNARIGARFADVSRGAPARYLVCSELGETLKGADIVVISILPGSFDQMAEDIGIPTRYGIPQAVGDTVGPGGFLRAMRAIPMLAEIGAAIGEHAPRAYVCNLTNPMSVLTGALYAAFPQIRAWGECHEVTKIRRQVAHIANQEGGDGKVTHRDVQVNVLGINHFTFVDRISLAGRDMMPAYRAFIDAHARSGWAQVEPGKGAGHAKYFTTKNRVAFDLHRRFGIPAAAGDRHLAEFLPVSDYLSDPERWGFTLTPVDYRIQDRAEKLARAQEMAAGKGQPEPKRSDEALMDQIVALMSGEPFVSNVNLPNRGQLPDLPIGAIVETNALFCGLGVWPITSGSLPSDLREITKGHAKRQTALLNAVMSGERDALFGLFRSDPLLDHISDETARELFAEMVAATAAYIPQSLKGAA